jgi:hypothetical protein
MLNETQLFEIQDLPNEIILDLRQSWHAADNTGAPNTIKTAVRIHHAAARVRLHQAWGGE